MRIIPIILSGFPPLALIRTCVLGSLKYVILSPQAFVIGGGVSKAGEVLLSYIQKYYLERAHYASKDAKFVLAQLGNDAGICGAAKLALEA